MKSSLRALIALVVLLLAAAAWAEEATDESLSTTTGVVRVGDPAPAIALTGFDGKPFTLAAPYEGKPALILFWSYFCFPCQSELPELQAFYNSYGADNLSVYAVSLDGPQYNNFILPFLSENKITIPIAFDQENETFFKYAEKYGVVGTPTFFIIDGHGIVRFIHLGRLEKDVLKAIIDGARTKDFCAEILRPDGKKAK